MHIGMIGGIGPAATEFYYRSLVEKFKSSDKLLELTIVHAETSDLIENILAGATEEQAEIFYRLALRLQAAGAELIAISSIAGHFCIPEFEKLSPLPIISAIPALEADIFKRGIEKVGLLGNRISMESKLFGGLSNIGVVIPLEQDIDSVHDQYIKIATSGSVNNDQRELLFAIGNKLCEKQGAEAVVLAGTDLFLAFDSYDCGFTVIDSALVHIDALFHISAEGGH